MSTGTITTGTGLISGINSAQIIDQLLAIDAQPKTLIQQRSAILQSQQVAFQDINAKLLMLKLDSSGFTDNKIFQSTTVSSSNPSVLTASSSASATPGSYNFSVSRLVNTQQIITNGFADTDSTPVGAGTLTFEFGNAKLDSDTKLSQLNGGAGVTRGKIRITDQSGSSAIVDLSRALTVNDVLSAINETSGISVTASVTDEGLKLTDNTGAAVTALAVANVGTTGTATSLGLNVAAAGNTITGTSINTLGANSLLASLNDGNGVRINGVTADLQIARRDGTTFDVVLGGATTLGQIITKINTASGGNVTASVNPSGTGLQLVDSSTDNGSAFAVTAINGSGAAADLGLTTTAAGGTITGNRIVSTLNSRLVKNLKGGSGAALGNINITNRAGVSFGVDLSGATSVSQVINLINTAGSGNGVTASLNSAGTGLQLTDSTGATASNLIVADTTGTGAADLGLAQSVAAATLDSGNLQFRYISESTRRDNLNGGQGVAKGKFTITDSRGVSATVDLSQGDEVTVADILAEINSRGLSLTARVNDNGDGILLEDTGPGTVAIKVQEQGSTTARDLGLLGEAATPGANLNGSFEKQVTILNTDTLDQVATKINSAGLAVKATVINDGSSANPYRLSLLSTRPGSAGAFVFDDGGLGLGSTTLVEAQDAVVFYGSTDPAKAVALTSTTNTLNSVIPGATVNLLSTSSSTVTVNISQDDSAITAGIKKFVTDFNTVMTTLNKYDSYNADTKQKGLLLGDPTVSRIRSSLYRLISGRNNDLGTQYNSLAQVGITVGSGATLKIDDTKFAAALATDRNAVKQLFTFKTTGTNAAGDTVTTAGGIGVRIDDLLKSLTDSDNGAISNQLDSITKTLKLNQDSMDRIDEKLAAKKLVLQNQFNAMEKALAQIQSQGSSLSSLSGLVAGAAATK